MLSHILPRINHVTSYNTYYNQDFNLYYNCLFPVNFRFTLIVRNGKKKNIQPAVELILH